jgi:hypothetical protein
MMLFPIIKIQRGLKAENWGRNATNTLFTVEIAEFVAPGQSWVGVLAQEIYECHYKWRHFGFFYKQRELELRGHAVECAAAARMDGYDLRQYELQEAGTMQRAYNGIFKDMPIETIAGELAARRPMAARWVVDHDPLLSKYEARL